jgi:hypothetical protein
MSRVVSLRPELNGQLFRPPENERVWMIDGGQRRWITPAAFGSLFVSDPKIASFDVAPIAEGNPVADGAMLVKAPDDPRIFLIDRNPAGRPAIFKRHVVGMDVLRLYQFSTSSMVTLPAIVLDSVPTGDPLVGPLTSTDK